MPMPMPVAAARKVLHLKALEVHLTTPLNGFGTRPYGMRTVPSHKGSYQGEGFCPGSQSLR
jgi:hypothetical protein